MSRDDLLDTGIYVYRSSTGRLPAALEGLDPLANNMYYGGETEGSGPRARYRMPVRKPQSFRIDVREENFERYRKAMSASVVGNIDEDGFETRERLEIVAINRATGYVGTTTAVYGEDGNSANILPETIVVRPPNL